MTEISVNEQAHQPVTGENPEISIIVPVYNVEKYLRECLDSIESQTFKDWECIVVDDGSPDGSRSICEEFVARDPRYVLVEQVNGGLSAARNSGLEIARGKYISFIDSDDTVYPQFLERMHEVMVETGADVVQASYEAQYTTYTRERRLVKNQLVIDRHRVIKELMKNHIIPSYMGLKMFRREVIDTPFPVGKLFEDIYAMSRWVRNINKMVLIPDILYIYRQRRGSILNSNYERNRLEYIKSMPDRVKVLRDIDPEAITDKDAELVIWKSYINAAKIIARLTKNPRRCRKAIMKIHEICRDVKLPSVKTLGLKKWIRAYMLRNHPQGFILYMHALYPLNYRKRKANKHLFD
ncbi:MAG: glycosyltransferase family 2 protein [Bacteroidales bacterium]|nr:glycosyltransferase family 2 protein [Bacteroidales bacterium]